MADHSPSRPLLARIALVVLLLCAIVSVRACGPAARARIPRGGRSCAPSRGERARAVAAARDTIARLRARAQRLSRFSRLRGGFEVRTEDRDSLSLHDGGLVGFDCTGRMTMIWLDGG
jgi:hypothetical protein